MSTTTIRPLATYLRTLDERFRAHVDAIDLEMAAASTCEACGHAGLEYRGFRRNAYGEYPFSYRCFVVCGACGHADEV